MIKREAKFTTELRDSFHKCGAVFHKISDSFHGALRFDIAKPFDAFALYRGVPIAIEAKYINDFKAFGRTHLRECQDEGLRKYNEAGGHSFVFLNIRRKSNKAEGIARINRLLIFKYSDIVEKGINFKKNEIFSYPYIVGFKGLFDMKDWLNDRVVDHRKLFKWNR